MNITISTQDDIYIIKFIGRMDATNSNIYEETIEQCFNKNEKKIIVELSELEYISSAGLRSILIMEKKRNSCDTQIVFCSLQSMVQEIFAISGFTSILQVFDNFDEAKKSLE